MNRVYRTTITISFDAWEPQQGLLMQEMDKVVRFCKSTLTHAGTLKISSEQHEDK